MVLRTIRLKLALVMTSLLIAAALFFSVVTVQTMKRYIREEVIKRAESLGKSAAAVASYSMLSRDLLGIDNVVARVTLANSDVEYVAVIDRDSTVIAHSDIAKRGSRFTPAEGRLLKKSADGTIVYEASDPSDDFFEILTPVSFGDKEIGTVIVGINKSVLMTAQAGIRTRVMAAFAATLVLTVIIIVVISSFITKPVQELAAGVEELKSGIRSRPLRIYSRDELGRLTESFNQMTELITSQQARLEEYAHDLEEAYVSTVRVLAAAIDARDPFTLGHSTRVAQLSVRIGREMGLAEKELEDLEIACLFHDVGKLKTPDFILLKDGSLDSGEYREVIRHPEYGSEILSKAPSLRKYIPAVRHHHEWYNGKGYPDGLSGSAIPLSAAIIAVADAFDAMTSSRPYKHAFSREQALQELQLFSGKQFHPGVVEMFGRIARQYASPAAHPSESSGVPR